MIKSILFDFDGTLTDYVSSDLSALSHLHRCCNITQSEDDFINLAIVKIMEFHQLFEAGKIAQEQMTEYRLKQTFRAFNIEMPKEGVDIYRQAFYKNTVLFPGVMSMLKHLKADCTLGLVTNAYRGPEQISRIRACGIEKFFSTILIAGDVGSFKPELSIFQKALEEIKAQPEETLFVGDSITHDIQGAKKAGIKTLLIRSGQKCPEADYQISSIAELSRLWPSIQARELESNKTTDHNTSKETIQV